MKTVSVTSLEQLVETGVVHLTRGKVISKRDIAAYPGEHPIYSSAKDNDGKFGEYGKYLYDEELITWSVDGGGRLFHRPRHKFSVTNVGGVLRIQDKSVLDYRYLYYVLTLRHSEIVFDWVKKAHPSVIKKLYNSIPVPGLNEQKQIVQKLDDAFAGIAKAKENAEKNLQNARALFESHLEAVLTQRGPGWVETTLSRATHGIFTGPFGSLLHKSDYILDGIPLVNPAHISEAGIEPDMRKTVSKATALRLKSYILREGDIVIGRRGEMGRCALVTKVEDGWLCGTGSFFIKPSSQCDTRYLVRFLRSDSCKARLEKIAGGAVMPNLSNTDLGNLTLNLPPLDQQKAIVKEVDTLHEETQRLVRLYAQKLEALDSLKKSILHEAISGNF